MQWQGFQNADWRRLGRKSVRCPGGFENFDSSSGTNMGHIQPEHPLGQNDRQGSVSSNSSAPVSSGKASRQRGSRGGARPPKRYRIGEIVEYSGVSRQTIHNYTTMGLIHESDWTRGGHRLYDESVFDRLSRINEFKAKRKSLEFMRKYFAHLDEVERIEKTSPDN